MITTLSITTSCPSGLRSHVKAVVLIGAGSNPADVIFAFWSSRAWSVLERGLVPVTAVEGLDQKDDRTCLKGERALVVATFLKAGSQLAQGSTLQMSIFAFWSSRAWSVLERGLGIRRIHALATRS